MSELQPARISMAPALTVANRKKTTIFYIVLTSIAVALFYWIRSKGMTLQPHGVAAVAVRPGGAVGHGSELAHVLLALSVVTLLARAAGAFVSSVLKQPAVIGEIIAGIMLGPSLLGALAPSLYAVLLPPTIAPLLGVVAKLGVVLFMFLVGLELDTKLLKGNTHATLVISHASIIIPFILGVALALFLYPLYGTSQHSFTVFSLFCGISMSVTAFPVLARILSDRRLSRTQMGVTAIACAAIDDATAWCVLAFVSGVAQAALGNAWRTLALVVAYVIVMVAVVRPITFRFSHRFEKEHKELNTSTLAVVLATMLLSACATEWIGIHALFGAFIFGALLPHEGRLAEQLRTRLEDVVLVLFVPLFFAFTGMRTQIGLIHNAQDWFYLGAIVLVATLGKFGGSFGVAKAMGLSWRESSALGILMNTRGLMELIVLNIGLDMGVLSPTLFAMLVLMALITTFMTTPMLDLIGASPEYFRSQSSPPPRPV